MEKHHRQENKNKLRVLCIVLYCLINKLTQTAKRKQLNIEIYFLGPFSIHGCQRSVCQSDRFALLTPKTTLRVLKVVS